MDKVWLPGQLATVQLVFLPRPSHISRGHNSRYGENHEERSEGVCEEASGGELKTN